MPDHAIELIHFHSWNSMSLSKTGTSTMGVSDNAADKASRS